MLRGSPTERVRDGFDLPAFRSDFDGVAGVVGEIEKDGGGVEWIAEAGGAESDGLAREFAAARSAFE